MFLSSSHQSLVPLAVHDGFDIVGVDYDGERVETARNRRTVVEGRREEKEGVNAGHFIGVLAVVALGEMPIHYPILLISFSD